MSENLISWLSLALTLGTFSLMINLALFFWLLVLNLQLSKVRTVLLEHLQKPTDFMKELLEHDDPRVSGLARARLGIKSTAIQTRAETLGWMASRGNLCVYLRFLAARSPPAGQEETAVTFKTLDGALLYDKLSSLQLATTSPSSTARKSNADCSTGSPDSGMSLPSSGTKQKTHTPSLHQRSTASMSTSLATAIRDETSLLLSAELESKANLCAGMAAGVRSFHEQQLSAFTDLPSLSAKLKATAEFLFTAARTLRSLPTGEPPSKS